MPSGILAFTAALVVSAGLTPAVRRFALRVGMVDAPGFRKIHQAPMPLLGGLAIYAGVMLGVLAFGFSAAPEQTLGIVSGATLLVLVGLMDDRGLLHHQVKLWFAIPLSAVFLMASGVRADVFEALAAQSSSSSALPLVADYALTLFWVIGITSACAILDHMDGLCSGVAAVASVFFFAVAALAGQVLVATLAAATLGASLGFLRWNFKPAKIFMGDAGAMLLGFLLATLGLKLDAPGLPAATGWMVPVLILGVPIFDTTLVTFSRCRRGLVPCASPGKDHTAHRLVSLGLGQRRTVLVLYAAGVVFGLAAVGILWLSVLQTLFVVGATITFGIVAILALERAPYERQEEAKRLAARIPTTAASSSATAGMRRQKSTRL